MPKTTITVTDPTGAEIIAQTSEPQAFTADGVIPASERPSAPADQLIGPPTEPLVQ
jgi:hypothetical protein